MKNVRIVVQLLLELRNLVELGQKNKDHPFVLCYSKRVNAYRKRGAFILAGIAYVIYERAAKKKNDHSF